eukprot:scaffold36842_cov28-Tisochrysis_lutea.AAC.2
MLISVDCEATEDAHPVAQEKQRRLAPADGVNGRHAVDECRDCTNEDPVKHRVVAHCHYELCDERAEAEANGLSDEATWRRRRLGLGNVRANQLERGHLWAEHRAQPETLIGRRQQHHRGERARA